MGDPTWELFVLGTLTAILLYAGLGRSSLARALSDLIWPEDDQGHGQDQGEKQPLDFRDGPKVI